MAKYAVLVFVLIAPSLAVSQSLSYLKKQADLAMEDEDYSKALAYAEEILKVEENDLKYQFFAARSSFEIRAYPITLRYLQQLMVADSSLSYPASYLLMAETKCTLGQYEEAAEYAYQIVDENLGGEFEQKRASRIIEICDWASGKATDFDQRVEVRNLGVINTKDSDFPVVFSNDKLRYVTYRQGAETERSSGKQDWCNCGGSCNFRMDWTRYGIDNSFSDTINFPGEKRSLSHFTFSGADHRIYYSTCECDEDQQ